MRVIGLLIACAGMLGAQDEPEAPQEPDKVPKRSVRLLAVGNAPPFRQEVRDGIRYELPPPPGSLPPRKVMLVRGAEEGSEGAREGPLELGELRLQLGRLSATLELREGASQLELRDDQGEVWAKLNCPEKGDFLVLFWRDPEVGIWSRPKMKVVPDEREPGKVRFLNVSRFPVAIVVGQEKVGLRSLQQWRTNLGVDRPVSVQLGLAAVGGGLQREFALALEQSDNETTLVVMSDTDGERARRALKMTRLRERVR